MERITATFDAETVRAIRRVAGKRGVSAFLQDAAKERLARLELLELLDDLDAQHGAPTAEIVAEVDAQATRIFGRKPAARAARPPSRVRRSAKRSRG